LGTNFRGPVGQPNGLELSCRASRIRFRIIRFSAAGPVSCSELLAAMEFIGHCCLGRTLSQVHLAKGLVQTRYGKESPSGDSGETQEA
jgi:hypothetical protein